LGFEGFNAVAINIPTFWNVAASSLLDTQRHFGGISWRGQQVRVDVCIWTAWVIAEQIHVVEIKGQLDATDWFFISKLIIRSTCFVHNYAHHQELKSYTDGCCLEHPANRTHNPQLHTRPTTYKPKRQVPQAATICITLELLMLGLMVPETYW